MNFSISESFTSNRILRKLSQLSTNKNVLEKNFQESFSTFCNLQYMSPVSPVFHTEGAVSIALKNKLRVGTSIL